MWLYLIPLCHLALLSLSHTVALDDLFLHHHEHVTPTYTILLL